MLKVHIANPSVGEFTWEPPLVIQQAVLSWDPDLVTEWQTDMGRFIERVITILNVMTTARGEDGYYASAMLNEAINVSAMAIFERVLGSDTFGDWLGECSTD